MCSDTLDLFYCYCTNSSFLSGCMPGACHFPSLLTTEFWIMKTFFVWTLAKGHLKLCEYCWSTRERVIKLLALCKYHKIIFYLIMKFEHLALVILIPLRKKRTFSAFHLHKGWICYLLNRCHGGPLICCGVLYGMEIAQESVAQVEFGLSESCHSNPINLPPAD